MPFSESEFITKLVSKFRRTVIGGPKDVGTIPRSFHKISLAALLAWIGLGADGSSLSSYGPEEPSGRWVRTPIWQYFWLWPPP